MYLRTLTLRGFKSFASATTLHFEPGITCVVGPNGSGKSNVVDALSWVMGEQGAKTLRGGKMEDVIFAGTTGRAPLGRAEVVLTIDNSDGALPIDDDEVTISRTMFRNGGSEYAINGKTSRLLDVQELLSDSGIGREMHVIVGQGRLDSILQATPEDRRGFVEEAAGVLKHRKRKERALRKLDATEGNLNRLQDLLTEIRRQLKPLGRQAEVARRAATIQAEVRDARARLLADDWVQATLAFESDRADERARAARRAQLEETLRQAQRNESDAEVDLADTTPRLNTAQQVWYSLAALRERVSSTISIAAERHRHASEQENAQRQGRDPEELDREADAAAEREKALAAEVETAQQGLDEATATRQEAENAHRAEDERISRLLRAAADRREGVARLQGQVAAAQSRVTAAEEELERIDQARTEAEQRANQANKEFTALESTVAGLDAGEEGLDDEFERAEEQLARAGDERDAVKAESEQLSREVAALTARIEALRMGLERKDGAEALRQSQVAGLDGALAQRLTVRDGWQPAIAAALGPLTEALVAEDLSAAQRAFDHLKQAELGRAAVVIAAVDSTPVASPAAVGMPAVDVIDVDPALAGALHQALAHVVLVEDLDTACEVIAETPEVTVVTRDGQILTRWYGAGGSSDRPSLLEQQAAIDEATEQLDQARHALERNQFAAAQCDARYSELAVVVDDVLARLHESDARQSAVAEQLGRLRSQASAASAEVERLHSRRDEVVAKRERDAEVVAALQQRLADAESKSDDDEPDVSHRDELDQRARQARAEEMDARLALRTAEERLRGVKGRADALRRAAAQERQARIRAEQRRQQRAREAATAQLVHDAAQRLLAAVVVSQERAQTERETAEAARQVADQALQEARQQVRQVQQELADLQAADHRDEVARAEQRVRLDTLRERIADELSLDVDTLVADFGPDQLVPVVDGEPVPFVRAEQQKRLRRAEKDLAVLGKVNPLALEEFDAMQQRHAFLADQLADVQQTRQDLLDIVADVDARVEKVFEEAYRDVEQAFARVFARLFPGGEGRLVLTEPGQWLTTGVEVEARPAGKAVKRLSLLSGGERSLVAVAFLVALFIARPSPFYILDEVEAALDDTNLGRLLAIYEELRENSQLIVITHQKRTMEVADALYGVSMQNDGVSKVISQRIR